MKTYIVRIIASIARHSSVENNNARPPGLRAVAAAAVVVICAICGLDDRVETLRPSGYANIVRRRSVDNDRRTTYDGGQSRASFNLSSSCRPPSSARPLARLDATHLSDDR
uniref:Secreted protein n=1 Tax=Plectus sambesii TaxID=2011161 RepID=A0A914W0U2_9BILA